MKPCFVNTGFDSLLGVWVGLVCHIRLGWLGRFCQAPFFTSCVMWVSLGNFIKTKRNETKIDLCTRTNNAKNANYWIPIKKLAQLLLLSPSQATAQSYHWVNCFMLVQRLARQNVQGKNSAWAKMVMNSRKQTCKHAALKSHNSVLKLWELCVVLGLC